MAATLPAHAGRRVTPVPSACDRGYTARTGKPATARPGMRHGTCPLRERTELMDGAMRITLLTVLALLAACATAKIAGTEIDDTPEHRTIFDLVERYRSAVEARDEEALTSLASRHYYENSSTTWSSDDDWGRPQLEEVLGRFKDNVKAMTYDVKVAALSIQGERADVDLEHTWAFQYSDGKRDLWTRRTDENRLELVREDGEWRIMSGM